MHISHSLKVRIRENLQLFGETAHKSIERRKNGLSTFYYELDLFLYFYNYCLVHRDKPIQL